MPPKMEEIGFLMPAWFYTVPDFEETLLRLMQNHDARSAQQRNTSVTSQPGMASGARDRTRIGQETRAIGVVMGQQIGVGADGGGNSHRETHDCFTETGNGGSMEFRSRKYEEDEIDEGVHDDYYNDDNYDEEEFDEEVDDNDCSDDDYNDDDYNGDVYHYGVFNDDVCNDGYDDEECNERENYDEENDEEEYEDKED